MEKLIVYQLLVTGSLGFFIISAILNIALNKNPLMNQGESLWKMTAVRSGTVRGGLHFTHFLLTAGRPKQKELGLSEGTYYAGNGTKNDIYIDESSGGKKIKMFLDVRRECIYLTIMKGSVTISGIKYEADPGKRLELMNHTRIRVGNVDLILKREEGI